MKITDPQFCRTDIKCTFPTRKGQKVRKIHEYNGNMLAGKPTGKILEVLRIENHNPVDGPREKDAIAYLSDGTWAFVWNLYLVD